MLVSCIVEVVHCNPYTIHRPKRSPAQIRNRISLAEKRSPTSVVWARPRSLEISVRILIASESCCTADTFVHPSLQKKAFWYDKRWILCIIFEYTAKTNLEKYCSKIWKNPVPGGKIIFSNYVPNFVCVKKHLQIPARFKLAPLWLASQAF